MLKPHILRLGLLKPGLLRLGLLRPGRVLCILVCIMAGVGVGLSGLVGSGGAPDPEAGAALESAAQDSARDWRICRDAAFRLDEKTPRTPALYLASARMLEACEADYSAAPAPASATARASVLGDEERMQAHAIAAQNYLKAGEIDRVRHSVAAFADAFPARDLFYPDGTSFLETMAILMSLTEERGHADSAPDLAPDLALANVSAALRSEMHRLRQWERW